MRNSRSRRTLARHIQSAERKKNITCQARIQYPAKWFFNKEKGRKKDTVTVTGRKIITFTASRTSLEENPKRTPS